MREGSGRRRRIALVLGAVLVLWAALGLRSLEPATEFGVLSGPVPGLLPRRVEASWVLAPPGLVRLERFPRLAVQLPLPQAEELRLPSADGSQFGFRGMATVRADPVQWRALHAAAGGRGLPEALAAALRAAAGGAGLRPTARQEVLGPVLRAFRRELERALGERGLSLVSWDLASLDFLAAPATGGAAPLDSKVLVVGLDGADWAVIDPLLAQGRMPNLAGLIANGVRADLLTIVPTLSPVVWTTVATGVEPARHGILDFMVQDAAGGSSQPVTSVQRRVPTVWEMLSQAGVPVGVVGWWATWPADPVRGYLVSDRIAYQLFGYRADLEDARGKTWPADLYARVRPRIVAPDRIGWSEVEPYLDGPRRRLEAFTPEERTLLDEFRTVLASGRTYLDIALDCRRARPPRLEMVYVEATDTAAHLFMPYRPPRMPGVAAERAEAFGAIVDRVYETTDAWLGRLLEGLDESWTVVVLSDHGFATDATRPHLTDSRIGHGPAADWHRRFGILVLSGRHVRRGARLREASVYDVAPTLLALYGRPVPASWPGIVLAEALDPAFFRDHPVRFQAEDPSREGTTSGEAVAEDPTAGELRRKLEALGYVSPGGAGPGPASNNAALALIGQGQYAEAEKQLRAALAATPGHPQLLVNLALVLRMTGKDAEARTTLEQARRHPGTRRAATNMLAGVLLKTGDSRGAERVLRETLREEPSAAELHNSLGLALEKRNDVAGADAQYRRSVSLDPKAAEPRNNLGNLARARGDLREAARWYEEAIDADPFFMGAYNNLALVRQDRGDVAGAMELYRRALDKAPRDAVVLNNLASLYYGTGDMDEARTLWRRAVEADPRYPSPLNNLAGIAITEGRLDEAERWLSRALELEPGYGDARINLASVRERQGRRDDARTELRRAVEDPRSESRAWADLGGLELRAGRLDAAIPPLERALKAGPPTADLLDALGGAYVATGRLDDGRRAWERALALDPKRERIRKGLEALRR